MTGGIQALVDVADISHTMSVILLCLFCLKHHILLVQFAHNFNDEVQTCPNVSLAVILTCIVYLDP